MTVRIQPNHNPDAKAQTQLEQVKKMLGATPNIFTTLAHSSAALGYYLSGAAALGDTKISAALKEQLALAVAGGNACEYCASAHTMLGKMQKIAESELSQNLHGKSADPKTQAALTFARQVLSARGNIADGDLKAIRDAGFDDTEIVEIITVICQNIFTNYFNHIAGTEVDFPKVSLAGIEKVA